MRRVREIYVLNSVCAVLVTLAFSGCAPVVSQVDASQRMLLETGEILSDIDRAVAQQVQDQSDAAIERAVSRAFAGACIEGESQAECIVRLLRVEMDLWYRLSEALETARLALENWQRINDWWRRVEEVPEDWLTEVCEPVRDIMQTTLNLLSESGIDIPAAWHTILSRADNLCSIGAAFLDEAGELENEP